MKYERELFWTAVMFFTRLPVPSIPFSEQHLNDATRYFPAVGWLVGGAAAVALLLAQEAFSYPCAVILSVVVTLLMTGAFHEDGLADCFDGLGGGWKREQVLSIMKDSRLGTYGTLALLAVVALKVSALLSLESGAAAVGLWAGHSLSRLAGLSPIFFLDYVDQKGAKSKPLAQKMSTSSLLVAAVFGLLPLAWVCQAWVSLGAVAGMAGLGNLYLKKRLGGFTGDCLGALQQLAEVTFYLSLSFSIG